MRILAIDTATDVCGLALAEDDRLELEVSMAHGQTHAKFLMKAVEQMLALSGWDLADIDGFVVSKGPGSFTGLRIGISTVKGLVMAAGKLMVGVSTLEVLAHQVAGMSEWVCPMLDARRHEVYWSLYRLEGQALVKVAPEKVGPVEEVIPALPGPCTFIGNGSCLYREKIRHALKNSSVWAPDGLHGIRPGVLAQRGWRRLQSGQVEDVRSFGPTYIRKSDAELNRVPNA
jgi:tRNA threonylcarbamoyladenosine biosynthesis protein TsaB